jgi:hypothetical protein
MTTGSSMQAMTLAVPPQTRHVSTSISPKAPTVGENPLQPLRPGHGRMTPNWRFFALAICVFGLATLAPLRRGHQRTVFAVRGDKIAGSDFEQPKAGPKGGGQDARSNTP